MASAETIKTQRDRFLAFAFASADLFIEVSFQGNIIFAHGAAKGLTGIDAESLMKKNWLDLFAVAEHPKLTELKDNAKQGIRRGPIIVDLDTKLSNRKGIVTGIKMPDQESFYVTLSISNIMMEEVVEASITDREELLTTGFKAEDEEFDDSQFNTEEIKKKDDNFDDSVYNQGEFKDEEFDDSIYNKEEFYDEAEKAFETAIEHGINSSVTVFDFGRTKTISEENWGNMIGQISELLREESIGGNAVGELQGDKYSFIHDSAKDTKQIEQKITELAKGFDPNGEGIEVSSKTVKADLTELTSKEASRALYYTLSELEKSGMDIDIETLSSGLKTYVVENTTKIQTFKKMIEEGNFDVHFQPIVNLKTLEAQHYEVLARFKKDNTQEWVMFGEDIGMSPQFDLAVVQKTMNFIHYKAGVTRTKFAINLSGRSIESPKFFTKLAETLSKRDFANRILFEITESTKINDLKKVSVFIQSLQKAGYQIALDDFGAGAASFEYLQQLKVNFVKIDGKYIRKILGSNRDEVMIRGLVKMCKDLDTKVIAEFVEDQAQADLLKEIGVDYAQGYLFGRAEPKPSYVPPIKL